MKRPLAFVVGVGVTIALQGFAEDSPRDPLPDRGAVRDSIRHLGLDTRPAQRVAFADGRIDQTEYRNAVFARIECLRSRGGPGIEIFGPAPLARGRLLTWHYRTPGDGVEASELDRVCAAELSDSIERGWQLEIVPQGQARRQELAQLATCLDHAGVSLRESDVRSVLTRAANAELPVGTCLDEHAVLFNL